MTTAPKPFVFVVMPFSKDFDDAYQLAIKPACEAAGAYAERVDQQIFEGSITERIYNQIAKADIIVGDMSDRNPNVFYEVGYAHALGKTSVLLTRDAADIPFDLRQYPHIVYGGSLSNLRSELEKRLRWHIENPTASATNEEEVEIRIGGERLIPGSTVTVRARGEMNYVALDLAVQNRAESKVRNLTFRFGIETPAGLARATDRREFEYEGVTVEDGRVYMHPGHFTLLPKEWAPIDFRLRKRHDTVMLGESFSCRAHIYFDSGALVVPFLLKVQDSS